MLSIILPAYNEASMVEKAYAKISPILLNANLDFEIIYINDGSKDNTWKKICAISKKSNNVKGIAFSRNFGKESAILAGLGYASGECCLIMDCDLQHPPQAIPQMYQLWEQGYEIVEGIKRSRGRESKLHQISAGLFYKIISKTIKIDMSKASDFKLLDKKAVDVLLQMREVHPFFRALSAWIGFKTVAVEFDVQEREEGDSKWSTCALIKYALHNITSFSSIPLQIVTVIGVVFLIFTILLGTQTLYLHYIGKALEGFTTVIILLLLIGSIIMISLGIIGYYVAKIFDEVKGRPRFIISETTENLKQ